MNIINFSWIIKKSAIILLGIVIATSCTKQTNDKNQKKIASLLLFSTQTSTKTSGQSTTQATDLSANQSLCGKSVGCFSTAPTDMTMVKSISRLGIPTTGFLRFHQSVENLTTTPVPVYAVADGTVTSARYKGSIGINDYRYEITVSSNLIYYFDHFTTPGTALLSVTNVNVFQGTPTGTLIVKAGDLLGTTTGTNSGNSWDFGVQDKSSANLFANQPRYVATTATQLYAKCFTDYYSSSFKTTMLPLLADFPNRTPASPSTTDCGTVSQDEGIQGLWFYTDQFIPIRSDNSVATNYGENIGITKNLAGTIQVSGLGASFTNTYNFSSGTDPKTIAINGEVCYFTNSQYLYFKLVSSTEMQVFVNITTGTCPSSIPSGYRSYYR